MEAYSEVELSDNHPLIPALDAAIAWVKSSDILEAHISGRPIHEDYLTKENRDDIITRKIVGLCHSARFESRDDYDWSDITRLSAEAWEVETGVIDYELLHVAKTWYPPGGHLGWHKDAPGGRFYATWADGKSFFRIVHPETGEIITSWDKPGWTFRTFYTDQDNPLWHCVWAQDTRISFGYRFLL